MRLHHPLVAAGLFALALVCASIPAARARDFCENLTYEGHTFTVCTADVRHARLLLFLRDEEGRPLATLGHLAEIEAQAGRTLAFGFNAGMFQADLSPVGLFIENGRTIHPANTRDGPGNFHLKPNGIFFFGPDRVGVMETGRFLDSALHPDFATQSGPMLVIDGQLHPAFQPDGTSLKIRNGVGARDTTTAVFAISNEPVSFHQFASLFRDKLGCANALFLDGTVSTLYAPALGRTTQWVPIGPMVGVTKP